MKPVVYLTPLLLAAAICQPAAAAEISLASAPPVVVKTDPIAGATDVAASLTEIRVTFSKPMVDESWSWSTWGEENFPKLNGKPHYLADKKTCVLPVKLEPGKFYATWLNSENFHNFKDADGHAAVPYLLTFETKGGKGQASAKPASTSTRAELEAPSPPAPSPQPNDSLLNADQRAILDWTDRRFGGFFDNRTFAGLSAKEREELLAKTLDTLKGPKNREYYQAISTIEALDPKAARAPLLAIATERADKDNRDRWMAIRALGLSGDKSLAPELIPLVYHGNLNTRWWAQISLVRITGQNFGSDWSAWGKWWNDQGGKPAYNSEIVRWWNGQAKDEDLANSLKESDKKFLDQVNQQASNK